jgi:hypothetical protein
MLKQVQWMFTSPVPPKLRVRGDFINVKFINNGFFKRVSGGY